MLDDFILKVSLLAGVVLVVSLFVSWYFRDPMLDAIPTVGFSDPILSYLSAVQYIFDSEHMLKDGYEKTRPGLFKIAGFRRWRVLAAGSGLIEDVRRVPDNVLSRAEAWKESLQTEYTLDLLDPKDAYSADVVRSKLMRDVADTFKKVREELIMAMDDFIPTHEDKWVKVPILQTLQHVICRTTNRIFVGVPLCRDHGYQTLNIAFATNIMNSGMIIGLFPKPLKPIVSRMLPNLPSQIQQEIEFIRPIVEERLAKMEEYGEDWDDKPNDMLMWLMSEAKGVERSPERLARRLLGVNLAAIHSTSLTLMQVLYRLLANPEYIGPLREEVDTVIKEEGWTKAGMDKMHKIDSFLRESQRVDGFTLLTMSRLALRPFTFSNGVTIPAGTLVSIPASDTHRDERIYSNAVEFDGFRFAKLRESVGDTMTSRYQSVSTSSEHLAFGLGRHVCPGRFLAVTEMKALFAYIVATYDIKFEEGKGAPRGAWIAGMRFTGTANVMFRTRQK
ncbi:cytochrome P450 [Russula ochroleuca]|uniref:Cytochrome P450 n=1 Tax=Russula ochroleuca TaxID=152965 RepID=A0A9P5MNJ7_9AGAM|nr:cytochrome P450 [Russula ochroleuca]